MATLSSVSSPRPWTGRLQWPAFAAVTLVEGLVLDALPPAATTGLNFVEGVLIATFGNLVLIGAVAPWLARRIDGREELRDRTATVLLGLGLLGVIASGLANRPVIVSETEETEQNAELVRDYVVHSGSDELQRNLETANTIRLADGYFRTCIARDDRQRHFCLFVDTRTDPPDVVRDPSAESNTAYRGQ